MNERMVEPITERDLRGVAWGAFLLGVLVVLLLTGAITDTPQTWF